jgi:hypothetical protein
LDGWSNTVVAHFVRIFQDFLENFFVVISDIVGRTVQNLIKNDSQRPNIDSVGVVVKPRLFGSDVLLCACNGFHNDFLSAESEVGDFDDGNGFPSNVFGFEEYVFGFEVAVSDTMVVQFFHSLTDLIDDFECILFVHFVVRAHVQSVPASDGTLPQRSAFAVLRDVPNACLTFDDFENLQNVLIVHPPQFLVNGFLFLNVVALT